MPAPPPARPPRPLPELVRADFAASPSWWSRVTLLILRLGEWGDRRRHRRLPAVVLHRVLDAVWTRAIIGSELPSDVRAGAGFGLHHGGRGIILATGTRFGEQVTLMHQVTFAMDGVDHDARAVVGDRVSRVPQLVGTRMARIVSRGLVIRAV